ncbi:MAG: hypothetical protein WCA44_06700 [Acidobacteriaceae bacterium]
MQRTRGADDRVIVGYFADGADASRAIHELIDEGFRASEMGAAFRARRAAGPLELHAESPGIRERAERNPATTGSVGGPASHDEAVTPAGLAPGSGNAFPAPVGPGPIPGSGIPSGLPRDLPSTLRTQAEISAEQSVRSSGPRSEMQREEGWQEGMKRVFRADRERNPQKDAPNLKFGTGEGHLFSGVEYSSPVFQGAFSGMGLTSDEASSLSSELSHGGAVVTVFASDRASLAEAILERNHGRIRFDTMPEESARCEDPRVDVYGRMCSYYSRENDVQRRRAS